MDNIIKEINKLSLEKGDILVIKIPIGTSSDLYRKTKEYLRRNIPSDVKVMIISNNVDIGLIKNETGEYWDLFRIE